MIKRQTINQDQYEALCRKGYDVSNIEAVYAVPDSFPTDFFNFFTGEQSTQPQQQETEIPEAPTVVQDTSAPNHPSKDVFSLCFDKINDEGVSDYRTGPTKRAAELIYVQYNEEETPSRVDLYGFLKWKGFSKTDMQNAVDYLRRTGFLTKVDPVPDAEDSMVEQTALDL